MQRAVAARLERLDSLEHLKDRFLHKVLRVGDVARSMRQPAARPPAEARDMAREQKVQRVTIAAFGMREQAMRRVGRNVRISRQVVAVASDVLGGHGWNR